jgi:hypothetical protein
MAALKPSASLRALAVLGIAGAVAFGCKKKDEDAARADDPTLLAQDGADTSAVETDTEVLTSSLVSASSSGALTLASSSDLGGGELAPADIGDGVKAFFFPRGCLTVTNDAASRTATYAFGNDAHPTCSGPNGLAQIAGVITVTYDARPDRLVLDLVGTGIRFRSATIDYSAHAEITASGADRVMAWRATLSGTTARGREFSRRNEIALSWKIGARCFAVEGTSEGTVKGRRLRTEIADYARCAGSCPEAGGTITITNVTSGTSVEIDFDGSAQATYSASNGARGSFPLLCL